MAHAQGAFDGLRRFAVLERARPAAEDYRADGERFGARDEREAIVTVLDDIAEEARSVADCASRVDQSTLTLVDQLADIEDRFATLRLATTMFAVSQAVILSLILWRVW